MILEDEAKQTRCCGPCPSNTGTPAPMHEHIENVTALRQQPAGEPVIYLCSASNCIAWRWEYDGDGQQCGWGYCGLAGKP